MCSKFGENPWKIKKVTAKKPKSDLFVFIWLRQSWKKIVGTLASLHVIITCVKNIDVEFTCQHSSDRRDLHFHIFPPPPPPINVGSPSLVAEDTAPINIDWGEWGAYFTKKSQSVPTIFSRIVWVKCKKIDLILVFWP
jgi:hypothetical protein